MVFKADSGTFRGDELTVCQFITVSLRKYHTSKRSNDSQAVSPLSCVISGAEEQGAAMYEDRQGLGRVEDETLRSAGLH